MLGKLVCKAFGHRVDRHRVWNDGIDFRTGCTRCGTPLLRGSTQWREFEPERDARPERSGHPRNRSA